MRRIATAVAAAVVVVLVACGPVRQEADVAGGEGAPAELGATLNVRVQADSAELELHVTNVAGAAVTLEFATAQRYDFEVLDEGGAVVWRWSADQVFAQMLGEEVLQAGESRRYAAVWPTQGGRGEYVARGLLTSRNYPVELRTPFRVMDD